MSRHVLEIVAAILLCLAAFSYATRNPIWLPFIGTKSVVAYSPNARSLDLVAIPKLRIRWPQFPNLCVGHCTNEEYAQ